MDLTPAAVRALRVDLHREFRNAFDTTSVHYPELATTIPSTSARNDYTWAANSPQMREWIGSRVVQNLGSFIYSVPNKDWEMTIGVKRNDIEDDNLALYATDARSYGESARQHPDQLLFDALINGENNLCFDGQPFFDVDHPINGINADAGVYKNLYTATPLTVSNYETVRAETVALRGANGRSYGLTHDTLVVGPALQATARRIVEIGRDANGADNPNQGTARVLMIPELPGLDWYLLTTRRQLKPFIFQTRRPLTFVTKNAITDEVVLIENEVRFYCDARYNLAYSLPFLAVKAKAA
jgi:phage major head subunit gpT-like protein